MELIGSVVVNVVNVVNAKCIGLDKLMDSGDSGSRCFEVHRSYTHTHTHIHTHTHTYIYTYTHTS